MADGASGISTQPRSTWVGRVYPLAILALISLVVAGLVLGNALSRMQAASEEIVRRAQVISLANEILSITRDSETGQRGYLLTGNEAYLAPYRGAKDAAPSAWREFNAVQLDSQQTRLRDAIHKTFNEKLALNDATISEYRNGQRDLAVANVQTGIGKRLMDRMRAQVADFRAYEERALAVAEQRSKAAMRFAVILTIIAGMAFAASGALMYAAARRARADAGIQAALASTADQKFKATFEQSGVGMMHIDRDGYPVLVNDAFCDMTGYSREDFMAAGPESPAMPSNLFSNKSRCEALIGGEVESYRHVRTSHTKDGREIYLASTVSAVRDENGDLLFLSAVISDLTDQHVAEKNLRDSQERLRRLQEEFAHVARVNDLGEMAAAIAHEINQPLTAITNYLSVATRMATQLDDQSDLPAVMQRASDQALRAGQIVKRMRSFVERTDDVREVERVGVLIDSAVELTLIGSDRDSVDVNCNGSANMALVCVDPIQFQQALIILMRNAMEAFATAQCAGKCMIHVTTSLDSGAKNVIVDVTDNGPGLDPELADNIFKPFVTSKPGNMGMGLSIAQRLIDSQGGRLTLEQQKRDGATFRITVPLVEDTLHRAA